MANKQEKILSNTAHKLIIRINEIGKALDQQEIDAFNKLIDKIRIYDKSKKGWDCEYNQRIFKSAGKTCNDKTGNNLLCN